MAMKIPLSVSNVASALGATCVLVVLGVAAAAQAEPMVKVVAVTGLDQGPASASRGHAPIPHRIGANSANSAHDQHGSHPVGHAQHEGGGDHAQHLRMMETRGYVRSAHDYAAPDLALLDADGNRTSVAQLLNTDKPVLLTFIYTTCTTICPVLTATFSQVQHNLGDGANRVRMISITIDPDQDTPQQLREYAERFQAGPQWQFITGTRDHIVAVQKAFNVYRGSKTNHEPITLLRASGATSWVRIAGIASAADIVREYDALASLTTE